VLPLQWTGERFAATFNEIPPSGERRYLLVDDASTDDIGRVEKGWASSPWPMIGQGLRRQPEDLLSICAGNAGRHSSSCCRGLPIIAENDDDADWVDAVPPDFFDGVPGLAHFRPSAASGRHAHVQYIANQRYDFCPEPCLDTSCRKSYGEYRDYRAVRTLPWERQLRTDFIFGTIRLLSQVIYGIQGRRKSPPHRKYSGKAYSIDFRRSVILDWE